MASTRTLLPLAPSVAVLLAAAAPGPAAQGAPDRIANTWNGRHHQPEAGAVVTEERNAGVRPSDARAQGESREVEGLYRKLEGQAGQRGAGTTGR